VRSDTHFVLERACPFRGDLRAGARQRSSCLIAAVQTGLGSQAQQRDPTPYGAFSGFFRTRCVGFWALKRFERAKSFRVGRIARSSPVLVLERALRPGTAHFARSSRSERGYCSDDRDPYLHHARRTDAVRRGGGPADGRRSSSIRACPTHGCVRALDRDADGAGFLVCYERPANGDSRRVPATGWPTEPPTRPRWPTAGLGRFVVWGSPRRTHALACAALLPTA